MLSNTTLYKLNTLKPHNLQETSSLISLFEQLICETVNNSYLYTHPLNGRVFVNRLTIEYQRGFMSFLGSECDWESELRTLKHAICDLTEMTLQTFQSTQLTKHNVLNFEIGFISKDTVFLGFDLYN